MPCVLCASARNSALAYELRKRGFQVERQQPIPIDYETIHLQEGFRADLLSAAKDKGPMNPGPTSQMVHVSQHPLVLYKLTRLRSRLTEPITFRQLVRELSRLLFYEATQDLKVEPCTVQTPLAECSGYRIAETIGLMPILRAGLGMAEAIHEMVPPAEVWHLGLYRDHQTLKPVTYYNRLPSQATIDVSFILDPMLATGGSAVAAVEILKQWGVRRIKFLGLIAAPEGVRMLQGSHPDVPIYLAAIDSHLDEQSYIVPGLGDAGDRQFGTG